MARPPHFVLSAFEDIFRQLRYAPPERLMSQMNAAERLLDEIEPERTYPIEYILFRITSYRSDASVGELLTGSALIQDLPRFIVRLSALLRLPVHAYEPRRPVPLEDALVELNISPVTLHRYRKQGLVVHNILGDDGALKLVIFQDALDRYVTRHHNDIESARGFSRISAADRRKVIEHARQLISGREMTLSAVCRNLAGELHRSPEAIRGLILKHAQQNPSDALFDQRTPLTPRSQQAVLRAFEMFVPATHIARHYQRSVGTIYRTINETRAQRLAKWRGAMEAPILPVFERKDAREIVLASPVLRRDLPVNLVLGGDLRRWLEESRNQRRVPPDELGVLVAGMHFLLFESARMIDALPSQQPRSSEIDQAETFLRWATRLKVRILRNLRPVFVQTLEIHLGRRLHEIAPEDAVRVYLDSCETLHRLLGEIDLERQPDLIAVVTHQWRQQLAAKHNRSATAENAQTARSAARSRLMPESAILPDLPQFLFPWRRHLELHPEEIEMLALTADATGEADIGLRTLRMRFGLGSCNRSPDSESGEPDPRISGAHADAFDPVATDPPKTFAQVSRLLGAPVHRIAAAEQRTRRKLRSILLSEDAASKRSN